jgi:hypothetical protein
VAVGVELGVGVILVVDEVELNEELSTGAGTEEETGGAISLHFIKAVRVLEYSTEHDFRKLPF